MTVDRGEVAAHETETSGPILRLDWLLRFDAWVSERYERERGVERAIMLRQQTYLGLLLYNAYNLTGLFLMPDILLMSVVLRVLVVTPVSLFLSWLVGQVSPQVREWIVTVGMINAFALPAFLFWFTDAPLGGYAFAELSLALVYGNMLLLIRFPHAIIFTTGAFSISTAVALTKAGLPEGLRIAFVLQTLTACVFTLYANYRSEAVRCRGYLEELRATLKSEAAEAASSRLLDLSLTDALTKLPNRRSLDQIVERWSREGVPLAVMMIDVDYFKLFNDAFGHPAGDECLRSIASALSSATAGTAHFVARFGGEEFTVVTRDLDPLRAARLAKRLVEAVEALSIAHTGRPDSSRVVTISVGIAPKPTDVDLKTVFKAADDALYVAKRRGRNCYVLADPAVDLSAQLASA